MQKKPGITVQYVLYTCTYLLVRPSYPSTNGFYSQVFTNVCLSVCLFVYLFICLSVCLFTCLFFCLCVCLPPPACLFVWLSVCLHFCIFICMLACWCIYFSVCFTVCLLACLDICMSVCMYLFVFIFAVCLYFFHILYFREMWMYLEHLSMLMKNIKVALNSIPDSDHHWVREGLTVRARSKSISKHRVSRQRTAKTRFRIEFVTTDAGELKQGEISAFEQSFLDM